MTSTLIADLANPEVPADRDLGDRVLGAFGYKWTSERWWLPPDKVSDDNTWADWHAPPCPNPAADLTAAAAMMPEGHQVHVVVHTDGTANALVNKPGATPISSPDAPTEPRARCIAALRAMENER